MSEAHILPRNFTDTFVSRPATYLSPIHVPESIDAIKQLYAKGADIDVGLGSHLALLEGRKLPDGYCHLSGIVEAFTEKYAVQPMNAERMQVLMIKTVHGVEPFIPLDGECSYGGYHHFTLECDLSVVQAEAAKLHKNWDALGSEVIQLLQQLYDPAKDAAVSLAAPCVVSRYCPVPSSFNPYSVVQH